MLFLGTKLSKLKKIKNRVFYKGRYWTLNKSGKRWMVLATKKVNGQEKVKLIHFGNVGEKFSESRCSAESKKNPWHANHWCCKCLTPKRKSRAKVAKKPVARKRRSTKRRTTRKAA